jgi:hypothetical protein
LSSVLKKVARRLRRVQLFGFSLEGPSLNLVILLISALSLFLLAGGVYNIIFQPPVFLSSSDYIIFYTYGLHEQIWGESIIAILLFSLGAGGGYLTHRSTRYVYKPREATMLLIIGIIMLFIAFIGCEYIIMLKVYG